jgi:hypothetical protein
MYLVVRVFADATTLRLLDGRTEPGIYWRSQSVVKDASPSLFMSHIMVWPAPGSPSQQKHGIEVVSQSVREMQDTSLD